MRRTNFGRGWIFGSEGALLGIALGYDYTAEHEWGVEPIKAAFQVEDHAAPGVDGRRMYAPPLEGAIFYEQTARIPSAQRGGGYPVAGLGYFNTRTSDRGVPSDSESLKVLEHPEIRFYSEPLHKQHRPSDDLVCAWDANSFFIHVRGEENLNHLETLERALVAGDVCLYDGRSKYWRERSGLIFLLDSRLPAEIKEHILESDLKRLAHA